MTIAAPVDVKLDGLNDVSGLVVNNTKGFTAAFWKLTQHQILNGLVSNASGVKASQTLDVMIKMDGVRSARMAAKAAALSRMAGRRLF